MVWEPFLFDSVRQQVYLADDIPVVSCRAGLAEHWGGKFPVTDIFLEDLAVAESRLLEHGVNHYATGADLLQVDGYVIIRRSGGIDGLLIRKSAMHGTETGTTRREIFIDARDLTTTDELASRGETKLAEYGDETVLKMEYLQGGPFVYLQDWDLGDIVHVEYPGIAALDAVVIEVTEEYTADDGMALTVVVGSEHPDLIRLVKRETKQANAEIRR